MRYRGLLEAGCRVGRDRAADAAGAAGSRTSSSPQVVLRPEPVAG
jgi:hypothetical protein